jgi:putative inorganic carbon (hco3(-)) transporter
MTELINRLRNTASWQADRHGSDLAWVAGGAGLCALITGLLMRYSLQAACAFVLVVLVVALYQHDRRWGIAAMFAFWFLAPLLRRLFDLLTGYVNADPLSLAPFLATGAIASLELLRGDLPTKVRRILLAAAVGFGIGFPLGLLHPVSGLYTCIAYLAGLSAAVLGFHEPFLLERSALRKVLVIGLLPIAAYAILQRILPLPHWDQAWLDSIDFNSIGTGDGVHVRVFASLNAPGTLAPLLVLAILCYLAGTHRRRALAVASVTVLAVALSLTYVRAAWLALVVGAIAHVIASRGRSGRLVFGAAALIVAGALALSPVSVAARSVVNRFTTFGSVGSDVSYTDRFGTLSQTLPRALVAPLGHGLGSAGEQSRIDNPSALRVPDDGYLALIYQVGPVGFLLVIGAIGSIMAAAWRGARARAAGQDMRLLLFAMLVSLLVILASGDAFYGVTGVLFWFIGGQALAFDHRNRGARLAAPT